MTLREYLRLRGETQVDFAERASISQATVSGLVAGKPIDPRASTIAKIAKATKGKVTMRDLVPKHLAA